VKTYQDGNLSLFIKIIPKYDSIKNIHTIGCWKKRKKQGGRIGAQNILPTSWSWPFKGSLEDFKVSSSSRFDSYKRKDHQTIVVSTQKMPVSLIGILHIIVIDCVLSLNFRGGWS
jgi:hypothetical protein